MKVDEIRVLEADELATKLKDSRRELYELRFKLAVGQLDDHRQIRKVRQDIARLLTFKRQRELGLSMPGAAPATAEAEPAAETAAVAEAEAEAAAEVAPVTEEEEE